MDLPELLEPLAHFIFHLLDAYVRHNKINYMEIGKDFSENGLAIYDQNGDKINGERFWAVYCNTKNLATDEYESKDLPKLFDLLSTKNMSRVKKGFAVTEGWETDIEIHLVDLLPKNSYEMTEAAGLAFSVRGDNTIIDVEKGREVRVDK